MAFILGKVNNDNVIGGAARVMYAERSYPVPADFNEIVNLTTYDANETYGWKDVGHTKTTSSIALQASTSEWRSEQVGPLRTLYQDYTGTATYEMEEMTQANRVHAGAVAEADTASGSKKTSWTARNVAPAQVHLCFFRVDPEGHLHATIALRAQWDGSAIQRQFTRGESESLPFPQKLYADSDYLSAESGDPVIFFDLDSPGSES